MSAVKSILFIVLINTKCEWFECDLVVLVLERDIHHIPYTAERLRTVVTGVDVTAKGIIDVPRADGLSQFQRAIVRQSVEIPALQHAPGIAGEGRHMGEKDIASLRNPVIDFRQLILRLIECPPCQVGNPWSAVYANSVNLKGIVTQVHQFALSLVRPGEQVLHHGRWTMSLAKFL